MRKTVPKCTQLKVYSRFGCLTRMLMSLPFRWSGLHQCRTNDCFRLQSSLSPIPFAFTGSALRAATSKRTSRVVCLSWVGNFGGSSGRSINRRAGPTFAYVIFAHIGRGATITSGELHGGGQGDEEGILTVRL